MDFIMQWFGYLLAFVLGSAVAWGATVLLIPARSNDKAEPE